ncbi:hypothetical protein MNEG_15491 [Monoraphidium neglectum]|uniref:U3 small nucleolar RNA-associated protein 20 domain-containing protein n=1 Tax=Monoraphidium neglectum TaxID=145388 RepID=A0A0D2IWW0_9CHLO|nr:hypothetical protein MNEG_15491 [Monoraphidium neglectum]KIY92472.1 hypothetical protein MNEG_15491 [Monoraphidium neglectum]|eukprot:XP_013891492.1 hypothetical protein MNEG_15491 [Monoraphidium neglectum]
MHIRSLALSHVHRRGRALMQLTRLLEGGAAGASPAGAVENGAPTPMEADGGDEAAQAGPTEAGAQQQQKEQQEQQQQQEEPVVFSSRVLVDVACPLLTQFILEGGGGDSERAHDKKAADVGREANVTDAAVTALRAAAGKLPWPAYSALLHQWLRLLEARAAAKPVVRAVCAVLDGFHFPLPQEDEGLAEEGAAAAGAGGGDGAAANGGDQEVDGAEDEGAEEGGGEGRAEGEEGAAGDEEGDEEEEQGPEEEAAVAAAADEEAPPEPAAADEGAAAAVTPEERERRRRAALAAEAQRVLRGKVLPALHGALVEQQWESVRPPVAVAIVKLLKLLPAEVERRELPRALQGVANLLSSRAQRVRDDARAVLLDMAVELGPPYLPYICQ